MSNRRRTVRPGARFFEVWKESGRAPSSAKVGRPHRLAKVEAGKVAANDAGYKQNYMRIEHKQ